MRRLAVLFVVPFLALFALGAAPGPATPIAIPTYSPNMLGDVLVLEYHAIGRPEGRWTRTPENLRRDLEYLLTHGYYPVNLIDVVRRNLGRVPAGRRPVVLTFDDSSAGHFRYLEDGSVDPNCAVGILLALHEQYGDDWPLRATFFVLLNNAESPGAPLFRQPDSAAQKVRALVEWGMEVGSHTIHHTSLGAAGAETVRWELAVSQQRIEALAPGYRVRSFSVPYGNYPRDVALLREGYSESAGIAYQYEAAVKVGAGPAPSPYSSRFDPFRIPRVQAIQSQLNYWLSYYEQHPERYYVAGAEQAYEQYRIWFRDP
jgi:peptidoglycan/xylan/chitin deacetylase (PgdA/CDA1 family)